DRLRSLGRGRNILLRCGDKRPDGVAQLDREIRVLDRPVPPLLGGVQLDPSSGDDARTADRVGPQAAERDYQCERNIKIKARNYVVDSPDRPLGLILDQIEVGRSSSPSADKSLERDRSILLNLFERREVADRCVEVVEGGEPLLRNAACRIES